MAIGQHGSLYRRIEDDHAGRRVQSIDEEDQEGDGQRAKDGKAHVTYAADHVGHEEPARVAVVPGQRVGDQRPDECSSADRANQPCKLCRRQAQMLLHKDDERRARGSDGEGRERLCYEWILGFRA